MPKDRERYRYVDVGLARDSWTLAMFEEDARRHQMSDQPGKLIALRLTEYYELKKEREVRPAFLPAALTSRDVSPMSEQKKSNDSIRRTSEDVLEISQQETENADEAADYWIGA